MADGIERELRGVDSARPVPPALYSRLESALLDDAQARAGGIDDAAEFFDALDAPRPIPPATRAALEQALAGGGRKREWRNLFLGAAAAVLLLVATVAVLRPGESRSNRQVAVGPARSVPEAAVPPVLQAPATIAPSAPAIAGAETAAPPTTRRRTTPTTWDCGLCARNGYAGSAAPPAPPSTTATTSPPDGGPVPQAAASSVAPGVFTVDPSSGPRRGGTIVTLKGFGFTGANGVRFGSLTAVNFTVVSDTEIRVMAPTSPTAQRVAVAVTYADGSSTQTSDNGPFFTYT